MLFACLLLCLCVTTRLSAFIGCNYDVTNTNNSGPGSLRQAIMDANANICFTATSASPAIINITLSGTITLSSTLPTISNYMVINGNVGGTVIDRNGGNTRAFELNASANAQLTVNDITVQNVLNTNTANPSGSGMGFLCSAGSKLTLNNCVLQNLSAGLFGAAIYATGGATVSATRCTFKGNSINYAGGWGGAVGQESGTGTYTNCTFSGNTSAGYAGTIFTWNSPTVNLINCTITGSTAASGHGAIEEAGSTCTLRMTNTIVYGNTPVDIMTAGYAFSTNNKNIVGTQSGTAVPIYSSANPNLGTLTTCGIQSYYPITSSSTAYHTGTTVGAPTVDICGNTRSATPNIGSSEAASCVAPSTPTITANPTSVCSGGSIMLQHYRLAQRCCQLGSI